MLENPKSTSVVIRLRQCPKSCQHLSVQRQNKVSRESSKYLWQVNDKSHTVNDQSDSDISLPPVNEVGGKVISLQASVCPQGGVPDQVHPRDQVQPGARYTPRDQVHPPAQSMLGDTSLRGWSASYWNAILFCLQSPSVFTARKEIGARLCFHKRVWFCSQGWCLPQFMLGYTPPRGTDTPPPEQTPPTGADTPQVPGTPPSAEHAGRYGQEAGGRHPTGMHSYLFWYCFLSINITEDIYSKISHSSSFETVFFTLFVIE